MYITEKYKFISAGSAGLVILYGTRSFNFQAKYFHNNFSKLMHFKFIILFHLADTHAFK